MLTRGGRGVKRGGFTLVEVVVAVGIVVLLASLLLAVATKALARAAQVQTRSEIAQLDLAVQRFETDMRVNFVPSYLVLYEGGAYDLSDPAEAASAAYLRRVFGKYASLTAQDWNGDGKMSGRIVLEGQHCLVFFLGGVPLTSANGVNSCTGFSSNPVNPAQAGGTRLGPYFENFDQARLVRDANGFFVYRHPCKPARVGDVWQPYAYFSAYGLQNGYGNPWGGGKGDCPSLGLLPYLSGDPMFANPTTHQIVSAGRDNLFGSGGAYDPRGGGNPKDPLFPAGNDNQSNFARSVLEAPR